MGSRPKGLLIIHTGSGKGKTTAALGLALRAWGQGLRVLIMQFIKGGQPYGELAAIEAINSDRLVIKQGGMGFTKRGNAEKKIHQEAAAAALAEAKAAIGSGAWDMIILDELSYALKFELVTLEEVQAVLAARPVSLHLVITGRDAPPELVAAADLVTEMTEIKHPFRQGVKAQPGIEY